MTHRKNNWLQLGLVQTEHNEGRWQGKGSLLYEDDHAEIFNYSFSNRFSKI